MLTSPIAMSPSNGSFPSFNYSIQGPTDQFNFNPRASHPGSHGSQQQMMRVRSAQYNAVPSPSPSVRSAVTAPAQAQHIYEPPSYHPTRRGVIDDRIDPSLLGVGAHQVPPAHVAQTNYNIERSMRDEAWNPLHLTSGRQSNGRPSLLPPDTNHKHFRMGSGSVGSAAPVSDSGIDSGFYSQSVVSTDASRFHQPRKSHGNDQQVGGLNVRPARSEVPHMVRVPSDRRSHASRASSTSGKPVNELICPRPECGEIMKCNSDLKYAIAPSSLRSG